MRMTIEPRAGAPWWWQVDDDDAVYSGTAPTEAEAWRQAHAAMDRASPVMVARAEGVTAGLDAMRARAEAAEARAAQAQADARVLACQWRAVDDTEDLQFFGACWREAHPGRSEGDLGRDPTMADLVAALRRALGGV